MSVDTNSPAGSEAAQAAAPDGFRRFRESNQFVAVNGPLFLRGEGRDFTLAFRVEERHCNRIGICHGGMLATFADVLLPAGTRQQVPNLEHYFLTTVTLQLDYIATVRVGSWVEGRMEVLRSTRTMVFVQGLVTSDGNLVLRCSGVFKVGPAIDQRAPAP